MVSPLQAVQAWPSERTAAEPNPPARAFETALQGELERAPARGPVAPRRTPLSPEQATGLLRSALEEVTGQTNERAVAVLAGQWAHETGRGESMFNYNFGGIKGRSPAGHSAALPTREGWGANERRIVDGFRAYATAHEGAVDYVQFLSRRYPRALEAAQAGDPTRFVSELRAGGYFTGNPGAYQKSVNRLSNEALASWGVDGSTPLVEPPRIGTEPLSPGEPSSLEAAVGVASGLAYFDALAMLDEVGRSALRASRT